MGGAWSWLYGVWPPESGYQPDDRLCYETYIDTDPEVEIATTRVVDRGGPFRSNLPRYESIMP